MKFRIVSLGCAKNLVESEYLRGGTGGGGTSSMVDDAETVIVNTCAFISDAARESDRDDPRGGEREGRQRRSS